MFSLGHLRELLFSWVSLMDIGGIWTIKPACISLVNLSFIIGEAQPRAQEGRQKQFLVLPDAETCHCLPRPVVCKAERSWVSITCGLSEYDEKHHWEGSILLLSLFHINFISH